MLASRRDCAAVVNQSEDKSQLSGFEPALSQPHARPVSIRELDAGTRQHCFNYGKTLGVAGIPADFDIVDCISVTLSVIFMTDFSSATNIVPLTGDNIAAAGDCAQENGPPSVTGRSAATSNSA